MGGPGTESFATVYDEYIWDVYGFFGYRLGSREDAEDLTQLTFERALRAWDRFDPDRAEARTWLLAIARNLLIDHYRRAERSAISRDRGHDGDLTVASYPGEFDLGISPELEEALGTLSQRDREIIALRFGADLTGPEIAKLTGLTLTNVQQILSRSLRRLRAKLDTQREHSAARTRSRGN